MYFISYICGNKAKTDTGIQAVILSLMRDEPCVFVLKSFHSQQEMAERSEFIPNSQKISIYACYAN